MIEYIKSFFKMLISFRQSFDKAQERRKKEFLTPSSLSFVEGSAGLTIATLGPIGYLPASGTCASALTLLGIYLLHLQGVSWAAYTSVTLLIGALGFSAIQSSKAHFTHHDPSEIVIDEVVGCLITFWGIPFSWPIALLGFTLFRFFDISKVLGIAWLEKHGGVAGIMLDDIGAGIVSNILVHILLWTLVGM